MSPKELSKRVGGYAKVAEACGLKSHTIPMRWRAIPIHHLDAIEREFEIKRAELRPDVFKPSTTVNASQPEPVQ